jgi:hypothetical protein
MREAVPSLACCYWKAFVLVGLAGILTLESS